MKNNLLPALACSALFSLAAPAAAETIFVDPGGGGDFTTISAAVAAASPGDTIVVGPGTYVEEVLVDVSVSISGAGVGSTIVQPATSAPSGSASAFPTSPSCARTSTSTLPATSFPFTRRPTT